MSKSDWFKWTVEYKVRRVWVADGFVLTDERAKAMLESDLTFANEDEIDARVVSAPPQADIDAALHDDAC